MARITMDKWIEQVLNDSHKDGPCTSLSCVHKEGSSEREVHSIKLEKGAKLEALETAELFRRKAEQHVQEITGSQLFFVYARYSGRSEPEARLPFRINGGNELSYGETEPPTPEGRASQKMRQDEFGHQFWAKMINEQFRLMHEHTVELAKERSNLMQENRDAIELAKTLILESSNRAHTFEMEKMKYQRESMWMNEAARLGPVVLNAITGKEILPQSTADSALIESVIENLTPEKVKLIQGLFPPQVVGLIMARAKEYMEKKIQAEQIAVDAVKERNDPVLDS